ncbi:MAG: glycosidase, partial [Acetatifactor sp.]|nr:glycosidase [Acetatifactor sp.]
RKIGGKYCMLSRPSDNGHTPFGDIFISQSPDMEHWGYHRFVMGTGGGWSWTKIGAGPIPIETDEGWLLIYHGVATTCSGMIYSMGAAILDIDKPWEVKYRCKPYILHPVENYECVGDVPNVTFPCATLCDAETGRIAIYYGAADTVVAMAFTQVDELISYIKENSV